MSLKKVEIENVQKKKFVHYIFKWKSRFEPQSLISQGESLSSEF